MNIKGMLRKSIYLAAVSLLALSVVTHAQEKKFTQTAGVDNSKMGVYRALAELSYQSFQKGDNATAAELAVILARTWEGESDLSKSNPEVRKQIDTAMNVFIKPLIRYASKAPDPAAAQAAYADYLRKLKLAD